jgi:hypothetical protein
MWSLAWWILYRGVVEGQCIIDFHRNKIKTCRENNLKSVKTKGGHWQVTNALRVRSKFRNDQILFIDEVPMFIGGIHDICYGIADGVFLNDICQLSIRRIKWCWITRRELSEAREQTTNNIEIAFDLDELGRQTDGYYDIKILPI